MFYKICPECGAHLDPGEKCDCLDVMMRERRKKAAGKRNMEKLITEESDGQLRLAV